MEGVSLLPLINGEAESIELPELFITETYFRGDNKISAIGRGWQYIHDRDRHEGVPELELQALQTIPNGIATDRSADYSGRLEMMRRYVIDWETEHRKTPPTLVERDLLDVERRQLEAVGYFN